MSLASTAAALLKPRGSHDAVGPIGIDFSLEQLHLVQLKGFSDGRPQAHAQVSLDFGCARREVLSNPLQFRSLMKRALAADRFAGRRCVIAVPSGMFRTLSINYRAGSSKAQEDAAIVRLMQGRLDGDLSDYVIDYLPVNNRSKGEERLALVAVSERQPIVEFLELARKSGLDVEALEIGPVAITRLVSTLAMQGDGGNVLVINSGRRASFMTLVSENDLLFDQEVAFGENALIEQVAETLEMTEDMARNLVVRTGVRSGASMSEGDSVTGDPGLADTLSEILKPRFLQLVEEIKRACLYAAAETRGGTVSQVYLLGSVARWPGSDEMLSRLTGTRVQKVPDPLSMLARDAGAVSSSASTAAAAPSSEIVVATGAALRGMSVSG